MTFIRKAIAATTLVFVFGAGAAVAQYHHEDHQYDHHEDHQYDHHDDHHYDNNHYVRHNDWRRGHRMDHNDWNRGERVDWRTHHLRHPPRGYEWRQVDGNYVMAAVATGLIASVIIASASH